MSPTPQIAAVARAIEELIDSDFDGMSANEVAQAIARECDQDSFNEFLSWFDGQVPAE